MTSEEARGVGVLGSIAAWSAAGPITLTPSDREALATLVAAGPDGLTLDQAAERFWGERQPKTAKSSVRMRMSRLRKRLGEAAMPTSAQFYRLALPVDAVDTWALRAAAGDGPRPTTTEALLRLLDGAPYHAHEHLAGEAELRRVAADRVALLTRIRREAPDLIDARVLVAAEPAATSTRPVAGVRPPSAPPAPSAPTASPSPTAVAVASPVLAGQLERSIVGRDALVDQLVEDLDRSSTTVIVGPGGSGKTRVIADVAARRNGRGVIYVCGHRLAGAAYGPFVAAVPAFGDTLATIAERPADEPLVRQAETWHAFVRAATETKTDTDPTLVVVDDAQWLDSASAALLEFLASSAPTSAFELVVAGRDDSGPDRWRETRAALAAVAPTHDLTPLTTDDLEQLVGLIHPSSHTQARRLFALELERLTRGLPAVARLVIENADPVTLRHRRLDRHPIDVHLDDLPTAALQIGAAVAVTGAPVGVDDLADLTGHSEAVVLEMLDLLHRRRLVRESSPERIEVEHVVIGDAIAAAVAPARRRRLHQRAAARSIDPHTRAVHLLEAVPLVPEHEAFDALVDAARRHADAGLHREAATTYALADDLLPSALSTDDLVRWAANADRAGLGSHPLRRRAFDQARADGDASAVLAAAMSGLPEAEPQGGDTDRLALLTQVDTADLSTAERFELAAELGRQYELLGRTISGRKALTDATQLAATAEDHARLASLRRMVDFETLGPARRLVARPSASDHLTPHTRARLHLLRSFDLLALGDRAAAADEVDEACALLNGDPSPLLEWWALLTRSTLAWLAGAIGEAHARCEEARVHGQRYGLHNSSAAWVGQQWFMARAFGPVPGLGGAADSLPPDIISSPVARAGAAMLRFESSADPAQRRALRAEIHQQAVLATELPTHTSAVVLGLLARFLDDAPLEVRRDATRLLYAQKGSWIVFGTGVFLQGPADLALADLHTGAERDALLFDALAAADKLESPPWRAIVRLELAARGMGDEFDVEARDIAAGTEFEPLLPA